ncbi:MAG TPA: glycosyltransferase family 2 protein [Candidatus Cybelea sp.]|nr:glycosyltransferase family 2 protein [Candidatus Cybelea sp.]
MDLQLSIVIPVYDNWWLTARCLRELNRLRERGTVAFETIVVDNASRDETPQAIGGFPWVRYVRHEENRNFAGACNAGVAAAGAPLTLLLNNDAYPVGDALTPIVGAFEAAEVSVAGGALFFEDFAMQAAGLVVLPNAHWHYYCRNLAGVSDAARPRDALGVSGAAMAVRTQWFLESGGFDESYVNGFEDVDLCMRARAQERAIAYVPEARFVHYEAASAGRFDREAANERLFYDRWGSAMNALPRTARGEVGAISIRRGAADPLLQAALCDLENALRAFGHPIVHGSVAPWQRFDRRFRKAATLAWFCDAAAPAVEITGAQGSAATIRTRGALEIDVPWLPCAAQERVTSCGIRPSKDPSCGVVGIAGSVPPVIERDLGSRAVRVTPEMLLGDAPAVDVACVIHGGWTDAAAFGNVLLAQAGIPAIALESPQLRAIVADDTALFAEGERVGEAITRFTADLESRDRYGRAIAADSRRRFSPRRSAIRVVDLLCAARFGLERPARALRDVPF